MPRVHSKTGGRDATTAVIPGRYVLSVGLPDLQAPRGWTWKALSSVARLESGHTPSRKHPEYWGGSIPWVGIQDVTPNHGRVIRDTLEHTNQLGIENSSARVLPENTVCLSRTASVGYVVVMGRPMATSQDFVNWVCSDALNPHFLKYVLLAEQDALHMFAVGSVHQTIYFPEAKAFHVCMPERAEQDAIIEVLGTLDEKIELNRSMNETLGATARAIFKDWFVDFGPTRAKLEGLAPYLESETWSLFPDQVNDDGNPEGWQLTTLSAIADINSESWSAQTRPNKVEYVDLANTKWGTIESTEVHSWDAAPSRARRVLRHGDTIVGTVRPGNGSYALVDQDGLTGSTGFAVLRPKSAAYREMVYCAATSAENIEHLSHLADGAAYPAVRPDVVGNTEIVLGPPAVTKAFSAMCATLIDRCEANKRENKALAATRDLLLPKLMSGEIRVRDAEKLAGQAAC